MLVNVATAFDILNHRIMLDKFELYEVGGSEFKVRTSELVH